MGFPPSRSCRTSPRRIDSGGQFFSNASADGPIRRRAASGLAELYVTGFVTRFAHCVEYRYGRMQP
jgi:hypothetical protein